MKCDRQCSYRTPYGYCSVTACYMNLGTTYTEPRHFKGKEKEMRIEKYALSEEEAKKCITVNEGIQEGRKLVYCKDCKYKVETEDGEWNPEDIVCDYWASDGLEADDFCSRGELK